MTSPLTQFFRITSVAAAALLLSALPVDLYSQSSDISHTVRSGDTLYSISRQYDISVSELREWNNLDSDSLETGMTLHVSPPEQNTVTHTVSPQETLFSISRRYGVSIAEIQQWNELDSTILSSGQELTIHTESTTESSRPEPETPDEFTEEVAEAGSEQPESILAEEADPAGRESIVVPATAANTYYTVQSGDYLNRIANEHGMTTSELRSLNNLEDDMLRVGQRLIVRESQSTPVVDEGFSESTPQGRFVNYRLEPNENRSDILERFSMTVDELEALNPGTDSGSLREGQRITVLLPATRTFDNPYRKQGGLRDLGATEVIRYSDDDAASPTTSGELYNPNQLTAAHANMALGTIVYIENPDNGRGSYVKVNDRFSGNGIKLSRQAFSLLDFDSVGGATAVIYQEE